ncbi:MAG: hypothetical protein WCF35_15715 [Pseudolabrys sp.]
MSRTIFAVAAVFVSLQLVPTPAVAQYYAVISLGAGDVPVHRGVPVNHPCGNRGFCNPNPYFVAAPQRSRRARPY